MNWTKQYQILIKSTIKVENLHLIPRRKNLATHGSHESTKQKWKEKILIAKVFQKMDRKWWPPLP